MRRRLPALALAAATLAATPAAAAAPAAFETRIAAAKTAMMAEPQVAQHRAAEALALARAEADAARRDQDVATAQWLQGEALLRLNRLSEAEAAIDEGLALAAARVTDTKLHGDLMMAQAEVRATQGTVQPALQGFQAAYRIFGKAGEPRSQAIALQNIGSIYQDARDYQKVLQYYAQSADTYPSDLSLLISADNNIGRALQAMDRPAEGVAAFNKARAIARQMQSASLEASILTNLASAELAAGDLGSAQTHLDEAMRLARSDPSARDEQRYIWGVAAQIQLKRHQPQAAAVLIGRTFDGVDLEKTSLLDRDFHETAYQVYAQLGDEHRALAHLKAFKRLDDQARELAASTNAALVSAQFDFANQQSRIAKLKAEQLQRDVELAKTRNTITTVLLAGLLMVAILLLVSVLWIRRSRNAARLANAALEKALRIRTEFLATTSHEIRTPLNGILGMTQVMLGDPGLDAGLRQKIAIVHGAGETMRALVDDILDIAKMETDGVVLSRAETDLALLCKETTQLWSDKAAAKGLELSLDISGAPLRIVEDTGRLRQILFNLMSNAIKFTETGGVALSVTTEAAGSGETLVLTVKDTGIGIPADKLEEVFESFRQADNSTTRVYGGTGLGLAICRRLTRAMGGDIDIESRLGEGSTVTLRLPLERAATPAAVEPTGQAPQDLAECRVLVCDPNPLSQSLVRAVLQPHARSVAVANAVSEAEAGRFDLVLVDAAALGAERQARLQALRDLASAVAPARVVLMTADASEDEAGGMMAAGAAQIIRKPIAAPQLAAELRRGVAEGARAALEKAS